MAASLCIAVGLLLVMAGSALALSGYGSPGPAVRAQYPDQTSPSGVTRPPVVSSLGDVMRVTRRVDRDPKVAKRLFKTEQAITVKTRRAVLTSSGISARQSGSIALLLAGIAVLSVGGILRWRRA